MLRQYEDWAWAVGIALICADMVLLIPQTAVIAALGIIYVTLLGGLLGGLACFTGGLLGYGLMLTSARRFVQRFVMPIRKFTATLTIGGVPTALAFAAIGAGWADQPILALVFSARRRCAPSRTYAAGRQ